jgi:GNAT superfamily N-acetyltransferase
MNLHDKGQFEELYRQRVLCSWDKDCVPAWRDAMDAGFKSLFWIHTNDSTEDSPQIAGHISLDSSASPPDPQLARSDRTLMTICTFFILPELRSGGLGRAAMELLESYATKEPFGSPKCEAIALTTISRRYTEDDGDEWRGIYKRRGMKLPTKGRSLEDWYVRQGYVKFKEEPRYHDRMLDGTELVLLASFLRKELQ